ncbi:hypothetical protein FEV53_09030 [Palleronia caenipelagi]|uniref:Uncharacterized protein n=1 Tax=Palleronia caenipelagi TaxID=2489174 RepID=A0A547Q318_9RHOB|nr:hypothetical protein FEV53_09030 [Palleronia caenipelagi]
MTDIEWTEELERTLKLRNSDYGGFSNLAKMRGTWKAWVELKVCRDWCDAGFERSVAEKIKLISPEHDPPDVMALIAGRSISIEVVQLVNSGHKSMAAEGEAHSRGDLFKKMQWSKERFHEEMGAVISKKVKKYSDDEKSFDVLLMFSVEPWLYSHQVEQWLPGLSVDVGSTFRIVSMIMMRETANREHMPFFTLHGDLRGL